MPLPFCQTFAATISPNRFTLCPRSYSVYSVANLFSTFLALLLKAADMDYALRRRPNPRRPGLASSSTMASPVMLRKTSFSVGRRRFSSAMAISCPSSKTHDFSHALHARFHRQHNMSALLVSLRRLSRQLTQQLRRLRHLQRIGDRNVNKVRRHIRLELVGPCPRRSRARGR